jgi:hypothetical protein
VETQHWQVESRVCAAPQPSLRAVDHSGTIAEIPRSVKMRTAFLSNDAKIAAGCI